MTKCKRCNGSGTATYHRADGLAIDYLCPDCKATKTMTNYDRIMRDMTIEQMAELRIDEHDNPTAYFACSQGGAIFWNYDDAVKAEIEWLKSEAIT